MQGNRGVEKTTQQEALCFVLLTRYYTGDQVKKTEMGRTCSTYGGDERCIRDLVGKGELRRLFGRSRRRWGIKINCICERLIGGGHTRDRSGSGWGQVAGCCECGDEPSVSIICGEFFW